MAISNLVSPGKKMNLPGVSAFFGTQERSANDNIQKISSTMLSDSMVSSVVETLKVFTSEIGRLQETSKNIVRSFVGLIKSFKAINRDINIRFKSLSSDLTASRLDFTRNILAAGTGGAAVAGAGVAAEVRDPTRQEKEKDKEKKEDDDRFSFVDALAGLLGLKAIGSAVLRGGASATTTLARGLGMAITNPIVAGMLGASTAFAAALFGSAAIGDWLENKFGIKEKIKAREGTEEYKELQKTQKDASEAARNRVGETRASRNQSLGEFLQSKGLRPAGKEIKTVPGSPDLITIIKDGHPDKGKTFNFKTGEEVRPSTGTPTTPAPPAAPTIDKATESARSTTDTASSSSTGAGEGGAGLNVVPAGEPVGSPAPAPAAPAPAAAPTGAPAPAAPAGGGGAPAPSGAPARADTGGGGEPLGTITAQHWMLNHPEVAAAYAKLSPDDKKKAAEIAAAGQESQARNFVMQKSGPQDQTARGRARATMQSMGAEPQGAPSGAPTAAPAPTAPEAPPATPAPPAAGSGAPVVVNNNSSQASESASNTEGNNVAGQNFPMFVADPFVQSYIQRQTPHYQ